MPLYIGAHASISKGIIMGLEHVRQMKGNVIQVFLRSPRGGRHASTSLTNDVLLEFRKLLELYKMKFACHSPYVINLCNANDPKNSWMIKILQDDMRLTNVIGGIGTVVHVGKTVRLLSNQDGKTEMEKAIRSCLESKGTLILETSCGAGTELLSRLEDLAEFYSRFSEKEKLRFKLCIDTCHILVSGEYDISKERCIKQYLHNFEQLIGIEHLALIHLNDSKGEFGSHLDRHENIGYGHIWKKNKNQNSLNILLEFARKYDIPIVLETPKDRHAQELAQIIVP